MDYISTIDCNIQVSRIVEINPQGIKIKIKHCSTDIGIPSLRDSNDAKEWPAYFVQNLHLIFLVKIRQFTLVNTFNRHFCKMFIKIDLNAQGTNSFITWDNL